MQKNTRRFLPLCLALLLCCGPANMALARPELAGGAAGGNAQNNPQNTAEAAAKRFQAADKNADGKLDEKEFFAAFPSLQHQAFHALDTNSDNSVSLEEWLAFAGGHSKNMGNAMPQPQGTISTPSGGRLVDLLPPENSPENSPKKSEDANNAGKAENNAPASAGNANDANKPAPALNLLPPEQK